MEPRYNVMRHIKRKLSSDEEHNIKRIKDAALVFHNLCSEIGMSRELSIAKAKIEEAAMWAERSITR